MNIFKRTIYSVGYRIKIIFAALFRRGRYLPQLNPPVVNAEVYGWANFFDIFPAIRQWKGEPNHHSVNLCRSAGNQQSSEIDVVSLMYDLARILKATRVIEVGIYKGASSLSLSQAIADNGGGDIHLVDISKNNLNEVRSKIKEFNHLVAVHLHHGDSAAIPGQGVLPVSDLIFLDADHRYVPLQNDIRAYWPLVSVGGILVIHDTIMWEGTRLSANGLFQKGYKVCTLATSGGSGVSLIRKTEE